jgi:hypothetical protein
METQSLPLLFAKPLGFQERCRPLRIDEEQQR